VSDTTGDDTSTKVCFKKMNKLNLYGNNAIPYGIHYQTNSR